MTGRLKLNMLQLMAAVRLHAIPLIILFVLTVVTYSEVLTHTFLINWDDQVYITQNPAIRGFSLENLKTAFTHYYTGNYAPVQIVSYMLDYTVWGGNPFGYLLANVCYHYVSGVLIYVLLIRHRVWSWGAALGTALFLVHPVQVESVAWLSQRKNLLAMLWYLLSFHAYLSYLRDEGQSPWKPYLWSMVFFGLALLSKSVAVIFPLMLILYDLLLPPVRRRVRDHADKIPYLIAAAVIAGTAIISQGSGHGGGRAEYPPNALVVLPLTMLPVLATYLRMLIWPDLAQLSIMYFPPFRTSLDSEVILAACIAAGLVAGAVYLYARSRACLFWYLLFFLGLLPVSQIVPLITLMNDRYLYFPMLGVAGLVASLSGMMRERSGASPWCRLFLATAIVMVLVLSTLSYQRGRVWKDSISLFSDVVEKSPGQATAWSRLGEGYVAAGDLKNARACYEKALLLGPLDFDANYNYVQILFEAREFDSAYRHIWGMLLGINQSRRALLLLGEYYYRTDNYSEAEKYLQQFLADYPGSLHGLYALGQVYLMNGMYERAGDYFAKTIAAGGNHPGLFISIACNEFHQGHMDRFTEALQIAVNRGLTVNELLEGEKCVAEIRNDPRFRELIRQYNVK